MPMAEKMSNLGTMQNEAHISCVGNFAKKITLKTGHVMTNTLNDTSNVTDSVFDIFQKRLEQLKRTFHH